MMKLAKSSKGKVTHIINHKNPVCDFRSKHLEYFEGTLQEASCKGCLYFYGLNLSEQNVDKEALVKKCLELLPVEVTTEEIEYTNLKEKILKHEIEICKLQHKVDRLWKTNHHVKVKEILKVVAISPDILSGKQLYVLTCFVNDSAKELAKEDTDLI